jgi:outer membrane receptor protein involved in Fe transport
MKNAAAWTLLVATSVTGVHAQTPTAAPAPAPAPAPVVTEITVTGERPAVEIRVDRRVYAVSRDLQAAIGSATDVLRNVPSVSLDIEGNPSLRGDSSVQIFIDGHPAPEFNGANRGAALEQLSADEIDRIEVITNPPANFKREGTAGIINIVLKRSRKSRSASARASVGTAGRYAAGTSQGVQTGKLNLRVSAQVRHNLRDEESENRRILRDANGTTESDRQLTGQGEDNRVGKSVNVSADYDASERDRLSAEGTFWRRDSASRFTEHSLLLDGTGATSSETSRTRRSDDYNYIGYAGLRWHHAGEVEGDGLDVSVLREEGREVEPWRFTESSLEPFAPDRLRDQKTYETEVTTELSIERTQTFESKARFIAGYDAGRTEGRYDLVQTVPTLVGEPAVIDDDASWRFAQSQTIHALYASFEQPLGAWTALAGLRLEQADISAASDYFRAYPTLHLADKLDEHNTLTFSYSRQVNRPFWRSMYPGVFRIDEQTLYAGNPDLKPSERDSLEGGWSWEDGRSSLSATVYARRTHNEFTDVNTLIDDDVLVIQPVNLGQSQSGGLELVASGRIVAGLDATLSGNAYYKEIDASNLGFDSKKSTVSYEAKAALNWRVSERNRAQVNVEANGKELTPQGYKRGSVQVDVGYRFQVRPNFAVVATASDVFASRRDQVVLDSLAITSSDTVRQPGRIVFVGVSWTLAAEKNAENFEYEK